MKKESSETKAAARTRAQKERVLAAAQLCFVERGFHAASMATIASTAKMSPGLIYRYFENKSAIILAIIEKQLTVARQRIRQLQSAENLSKRIFDYLEEKEPEDEKSMSIALYLEISAQATRDPQIAAALRVMMSWCAPNWATGCAGAGETAVTACRITMWRSGP